MKHIKAIKQISHKILTCISSIRRCCSFSFLLRSSKFNFSRSNSALSLSRLICKDLFSEDNFIVSVSFSLVNFLVRSSYFFLNYLKRKEKGDVKHIIVAMVASKFEFGQFWRTRKTNPKDIFTFWSYSYYFVMIMSKFFGDCDGSNKFP